MTAEDVQIIINEYNRLVQVNQGLQADLDTAKAKAKTADELTAMEQIRDLAQKIATLPKP